MGIKNLRVILNQKCRNAINTRKLSCYAGMKIGIDLSIFLYKYLYNNGDHIEGLTRLILRLLKNQITPVFVLDGKPPKEKDETIQERKEKKEILSIKKNIIDNCINMEKNDFQSFKTNVNNIIEKTNNETFIIDETELKLLYDKTTDELEKESDKITRKIIHVTSYHIDSCKKLFDLFGIKYIHQPCEAESLMAVLCKEKIIDACISEDTDILANGGFIFLRDFNADKNTVEEYCLEGILNGLEMKQEQFIDMCILCGCDYTTKINGIGPINAYKLILKYGNIETVIEYNKKYVIPNNFNYQKARELFKNPVDKNILDKIDKNICLNIPKYDELKVFLEKSKLKEKYFDEIETNIMNYYLNIEDVNQIVKELHFKTKTKKIKLNNNKKITDFFGQMNNLH